MCIFCKLYKEQNYIIDSESFFVVWDIDPIQKGHMLIISKKHIMNYLDLSPKELLEFNRIQSKIVRQIEQLDTKTGATLIINNGHLMDDNTHFHCHIIPRFKQDKFWDKISPEKIEFSIENFERTLKLNREHI